MREDLDETRAMAASPSQLTAGATLNDRYRLDTELGRGGMGIVYRATDLQLRRQVAVKLMTSAAPFSDAPQRLLREGRAAAALNHPHIVSVYDTGEDHGVPYLVMELVAGDSLRDARLDLEQIVAVGGQICDALSHAHAHDIVHRDLKPENILVADAGPPVVVKVTDLGIAVPMRGSRESESGLIVGTVTYMAPEQAMGEPIDGRADLYSLGVVLYELATGRPPFVADQPLGVVSQHVHAPVVPPRAHRPDLPAGLEQVILTMLAKEPGGRFQSARAAGEALQKCLVADVSDPGEPGVSVAILDMLSRGRLVGRSEEVAEARELWRRTVRGKSHALLVAGEPGVGKTRFARELMIQVGIDDGVVLTGACYEFDAATPYLPFAEALRLFVRQESDDVALRRKLGDVAPQLVRLAPEIERRLGPFPERHVLPANEERLLLFDAVTTFFERLATTRGLLFYVDDLQWADGSTLGLLSHLFRHLRQAPVLITASYREIELDRAHPLANALAEWNRERLTTRLVLKRLSPEATSEQLSSLLGERVDGAFAAAVHRETDGNPFFVEEVLKTLIEHGSVRRESGRWRHGAVQDLELPQSIKAAIGRRLDRVAPESNDVLRAAAVLGKTFDFSELAAVEHDRNEDALLDALDEAAAAQLVRAEDGERFAFTHDKIREVLYEELNPIRRRRLHLRTAEGLERYRATHAVPAEKLAYHYVEAGQYAKCLTFTKEAAADAAQVFAYDEALAAYEKARECADALGSPAERAAVDEAMGDLCNIAGNQIAALGHFEAAISQAGTALHRARLQCRAASSLVALGDERGLAYIREARAVLDQKAYPVEVARALSTEARFHHLAGTHRRAIELLEQAVALAEPEAERTAAIGDAASALIQIYTYLSGAHQHLGLFDDGDRWAHRAIDFGASHNYPAAKALGYEFLAENAAVAGNWVWGLDCVAKEREIAERIRSRERLAWTCLPAGDCTLGLGDVDRAESEFRHGVALAEQIGETRLRLLASSSLAQVLAERQQLDEAIEVGRRALASADAVGLLYLRTEARRCLAHVYFRGNDVGEAVRLCAEVLSLTEGLEPRVSRLRVAPLHVEVLLAAGRLEDARTQTAAFTRLAAVCQSPLATRESARLESLVAG